MVLKNKNYLIKSLKVTKGSTKQKKKEKKKGGRQEWTMLSTLTPKTATWKIPKRSSIAETRRDKLSDLEKRRPTPFEKPGIKSVDFNEEQQEEDIGWLMPYNFFGYFGSEECDSEVRSKIAEFCPKSPSHDHHSGKVKWRQRRSRFASKSHNWWRIMGIWLWRRSQNTIVSMEAHWITKTEKSTWCSVKCQGFAHCFLWLSWRSASEVLTARSYG